ncbi:M57 family metalloprotease [Hymenobacter convexus]|uniref:M57 family metalloprotease n=1 Tax=Hymenobacter sp. CA1UV-4 TaxID=3063782 RepID=UPI0027130C27|nr:M57 family metalloprotease [Hymenobacter sp. CA1UV-4]MDO7851259.1 M57 family metalloprotease [Hymenobacter sp. CA1UV-4]
MRIKNALSTAALCAASALALFSCSKQKEETTAAPAAVSQQALAQIKALGFGTQDVRAVDGGYVVEGDIMLTPDLLASAPGYSTLRVGDEEQYRTTNLVTGLPRVLTVSISSSFNSYYVSAIDEAIRRYNAANLRVQFRRVSSGAEMPVKYSSNLGTGVLGQSGGFPSGGNPAPGFTLVPNVINSTNINYIATIMAHEMGHCIGMRHTDYYNRAYSCGGSASNEGASTVGAILIPGTPSTAEPNSWMLACVGNGVNRPFTANDLTALNYIY